jgi:HPt (histidine-containing phosphotransfer) domain-containing protein
MTGNTSQEDIAACYAAGMDGFMGKPIEPDKLKSILQKASIPGGLAKAQPTQPAPKDTTGGYVPMPPPAPATLPQNVSGFGFDFPGAGDNEDEDTFASAIRKFEELESKAGTTGDQNLDNAIISSLKATLNPDQLQELLVSFYEKAEELIAAIEHAFMQNDLDNLRARAHELKGMSGNFGFSGVGTISGTIEKAAKDQVTAELQEHIKKLGEVYAISKMRMGNTAQ